MTGGTVCGTVRGVVAFNLRLPDDLHAALVREAERQGVSLNQYCVALLAGGISFKVKG